MKRCETIINRTLGFGVYLWVRHIRSPLTALFTHGTMGRDRTLGFGGIPLGGTCENLRDSHMHSMGLWDGMGHWVLGVRMGGCMVIPGTVLPILQYDSTILQNSLQSHGM